MGWSILASNLTIPERLLHGPPFGSRAFSGIRSGGCTTLVCIPCPLGLQLAPNCTTCAHHWNEVRRHAMRKNPRRLCVGRVLLPSSPRTTTDTPTPIERSRHPPQRCPIVALSLGEGALVAWWAGRSSGPRSPRCVQGNPEPPPTPWGLQRRAGSHLVSGDISGRGQGQRVPPKVCIFCCGGCPHGVT